YSEGSDGIRVLTTRYRTRPIKEDTREEVRKLESERKKLQESAQKLQADMAACQQNLHMLNKLEDFTAGQARGAHKAAAKREAVIAMARYVMESRAAKTKESVALQQEFRDNQEQAQFVDRQLQDLAAGTSRVERDAVIVVDKTNGAGGKIRLNYLVNA